MPTCQATFILPVRVASPENVTERGLPFGPYGHLNRCRPASIPQRRLGEPATAGARDYNNWELNGG